MSKHRLRTARGWDAKRAVCKRKNYLCVVPYHKGNKINRVHKVERNNFYLTLRPFFIGMVLLFEIL